MDFELGRTYSGYKFLDVVERSRHIVQYRVQNTLTQRLENLRALPAAAAGDPDASERFLREIRIRARLVHPHIVAFYTALPVDGQIVMTTEIADALSLAERLKLGPLPWPEALALTRQLLDALTCLHQQSMLHCGLTPEGVLFGPAGFCKLADFARARPLDPAHAPESGTVVGDPRYTSPEQIRGESTLDARSDFYSLGVVLYEMLTGYPPFKSRSQFELMLAHVNEVPVAPSQLNSAAPRALDGLVLKALAKTPVGRYQSAAEFADALNLGRNAAASSEPTDLLSAPTPTAPDLHSEIAPPAVNGSTTAPAFAREPATAPPAYAIPACHYSSSAVAIMDAPSEFTDLNPIARLVEAQLEAAVISGPALAANGQPHIAAEPDVQFEALMTALDSDLNPTLRPGVPTESDLVIQQVEPALTVTAESAESSIEAAAVAPVARASELADEPAAVAVVTTELELVTAPPLTAVEGAVEPAIAIEVEPEIAPANDVDQFAIVPDVAPEPTTEVAAEVESAIEPEPAVPAELESIVALAYGVDHIAFVPNVPAEAINEVESEIGFQPKLATEAATQVVTAVESFIVLEPAVTAELTVEGAVDGASEIALEPNVGTEAAIDAEPAAAELESVFALSYGEFDTAVVSEPAGEPEPVIAPPDDTLQIPLELTLPIEPATETQPVVEPVCAPPAAGLEPLPTLVAEIATAHDSVVQLVLAAEVETVVAPHSGATQIAFEVAVSTPPANGLELVIASVVSASESQLAPSSIAEIAAEPEHVLEPVLAIEGATGPTELAVEPVPAETPAQIAIAPSLESVPEPPLATAPQADPEPLAAPPVAAPEAALASLIVATTSANPEAPSAPPVEQVVSEPAIALGAPAIASAVAPTAAAVTPTAVPAFAPTGIAPVAPFEAATQSQISPLHARVPTDPLPANLWAAAQLVAAFAAAPVPMSPPPAPVPIQIARSEPSQPPVAFPLHAPEPESTFMTTFRRAPDSVQWAVFGGTAAFLGVLLTAIWFAVGK